MREKILGLLGLMRRASAIAVGEENTAEAVKAGKARLLLTASDASPNAKKRAAGFAAGRRVLPVELPFTKEELSGALGVGGCAMAAVTDLGFADALMKQLAGQWPERYEATAAEVAARSEKARRRKAETAQQRNKRNGKRRTNV